MGQPYLSQSFFVLQFTLYSIKLIYCIFLLSEVVVICADWSICDNWIPQTTEEQWQAIVLDAGFRQVIIVSDVIQTDSKKKLLDERWTDYNFGGRIQMGKFMYLQLFLYASCYFWTGLPTENRILQRRAVMMSNLRRSMWTAVYQ
jgi:hypothetical protein